MRILKVLLFPFAMLYDLVTSLRNRLYDLGYKPSAAFDCKVISVGNLSVGGTGKTPMIEYLIRLLEGHHMATLSRGYGRTTRGIRIADASESADTIGDEPFQFYQKYGDNVRVVVGEERALAIPFLIDQFPDTEVVLLDDAFQHRKVRPDFQVLLTDFNRPFYSDLLLPAGRLRESRKGAARADVVVVTKCPLNLPEDDQIEIETEIKRYTQARIFFAATRYGEPVGINTERTFTPGNVVLVTGIAQARPLEAFVDRNYRLLRHFRFADHHPYTKKDLEEITAFARQQQAAVLTTEKDAGKLRAPVFSAFLSQAPFFYLPIETEFLKNGRDFDEMVLNVVKNA